MPSRPRHILTLHIITNTFRTSHNPISPPGHFSYLKFADPQLAAKLSIASLKGKLIISSFPCPFMNKCLNLARKWSLSQSQALLGKERKISRSQHTLHTWVILNFLTHISFMKFPTFHLRTGHRRLCHHVDKILKYRSP